MFFIASNLSIKSYLVKDNESDRYVYIEYFNRQLKLGIAKDHGKKKLLL